MSAFEVALARADGIDQDLTRLDELLESLRNARDEVYQAYEALVETWENSWTWWKRHLFNRSDYDGQREALESVWSRLQNERVEEEGVNESLLELADRVLHHHTPIVSLFLTSSRWVTDTYQPVSAVYGDIALPAHDRALAEWQGEAREAYDSIVEHQHQALAAMRDVAGEISIWLSDLATTNVEFIAELTSHLGKIAEKILAEARKIANTGGLGSLWGISATVGRLINSAIAALGTVIRNFASAITGQIAADRILMDHSHFPGGDWPHAVSRPRHGDE